ncbi:LysR substrate-binding domain-containing protein [Acinetobacter sp. NIPH 2699]|uniref:LysR substrate-binding domain-containing protein n=1 Tax=Acinetobacter sp. NIPH 2699 TaxID=2923433 RepID=UPI001F4B7F05|nr:LysR substrate-binding domain-containing protein [Acinetobacter sp. NIPH 2699]MCH7336508.1 LysR substrate-binding domain-containing protein [Acinetobacter sp. NIPH 2699]
MLLRQHLNDVFLFVVAVEHQGFSAAAKQLNLPKSTISKRVAALEQKLGLTLIHRSSRSFVLSEAGKLFYQHAKNAVDEFRYAEENLLMQQQEPSGVVRLSASVPVAQYILSDCLPELAERYPKLLLQLEVTDRYVDVMSENFDIVIRSHFQPLVDSGLIQRVLTHDKIIAVAAQTYVMKAEPIGCPNDLVHHQGLWSDLQMNPWHFQHLNGEKQTVRPNVRFMANESEVLKGAVKRGIGITLLPESFCINELSDRSLVNVLPEWTAGSVTTSLLMLTRRGLLPSVNITADFLVEKLKR